MIDDDVPESVEEAIMATVEAVRARLARDHAALDAFESAYADASSSIRARIRQIHGHIEADRRSIFLDLEAMIGSLSSPVRALPPPPPNRDGAQLPHQARPDVDYIDESAFQFPPRP